MKRFLLLAALLISPMMQAHALIIGIALHFPPFSMSTGPEQFSGFEVELSKAICQRINETCLYKAMPVRTIPDELLAQKIDLGMATLIIPLKPSSGYLFSQPYLPSSMQFIVKKDSSIHSSEDLTNKTVGVRNFFGVDTFKSFMLKFYNNKINIKDFPTMDDLIDALQNDNLHAGLANSSAVHYWVANNSNLFRVVGDVIPYGNGYGIMANIGQEVLIGKINAALKAMIDDGTYSEIYSHYFLN